jgi:hypothetical protein
MENKMKKLMMVLVVAGSFVNVAQADTYSVSAARVSGQVNCVYTKANGGSTQCSTEYENQGVVSITMGAKSDGTGYLGTDQTTDTNSVYILALESDASRNLTAVSTMQFTGSQTSVDGGLSASNTNTLSIVNIAPLHIQSIDDQTALITMSFYAYAPATGFNMVTNHNHQDLTHYIQVKIQPALVAALR